MRRKLDRSELQRMKVSEIIYKKVVHNGADMKDRTLSNTFRTKRIYEFRIREDGALLMVMANTALNAAISKTNRYVFKINSGLKDSQFMGYRWVRKRTSMGYVMGLKSHNRWANAEDKFTEIFNELDIKMIRAARDSMIRKMKKETEIKDVR